MTRLDRSLHIANACSSTSRRRRTTCVHPLHASRNAVDASNASSGVMRSTNRILGLDGVEPDASIAIDDDVTVCAVVCPTRSITVCPTTRSIVRSMMMIRNQSNQSVVVGGLSPILNLLVVVGPRASDRAMDGRTNGRTRSGRDRVAIGSRARASRRQRVRAAQRVQGDDACIHACIHSSRSSRSGYSSSYVYMWVHYGSVALLVYGWVDGTCHRRRREEARRGAGGRK